LGSGTRKTKENNIRLKTVLIISPHFPPVNAADMHRVRQSVGFFSQYEWKPIVVCVKPKYVEQSVDMDLCKTVSHNLEVIKVNAINQKITRKIGFGSLGIRSFFSILKASRKIIKKEKVDLVYISSTVFYIFPIGRILKKLYKTPFILDFQDPWFHDYYLTLPKNDRPPKHLVNRKINQLLERYTVPHCAGIVSVNDFYIENLKKRYQEIKSVPTLSIPFGAHELDIEVAKEKTLSNLPFELNKNNFNIVYAGAISKAMEDIVECFILGFKKFLEGNDINNIKIYFVGTTYSKLASGTSRLQKFINQNDLGEIIYEFPNRMSYFSSLKLISEADLSLIIGSNNYNYTASKLFPYILSKSPILCVFHQQSSVIKVLHDINYGKIVSFQNDYLKKDLIGSIQLELNSIIIKKNTNIISLNEEEFNQFKTIELAKKQIALFNRVIELNK
jgi:hypothetical protein